MDDHDSPGLSVGFAVETGGSFENLLRLERAMDATESKLLPAAARIERATADMVNLGDAVAQVTSFSNAASRAEQTIRRERAQTAKEIERTIKLLDREAASAGQTRDQQRAQRVEELAVAAARNGNTEAADRLFTSSRRLKAVQTALAEDRLAAEMKATAAAAHEREMAEAGVNRQLLERSRLEAALERNTGVGRVSATDAGATFSALAARAAEDEARAVREAAFAHQQFDAAVRRGLAAMREQEDAARATAAAEALLAREAAQVRAALDPMFAAQQRFDVEMERADRLLAAGVFREREYAQAVQLARDALREHAEAVAGSGRSLDDLDDHQRRGAEGNRQLRQAMAGASYQVQDFVTQISMGANPINAFVVQGGQLAGQFMMVEGKAGAVARFLMGGWGLALQVGLMAFAPFIAKLWEGGDASDKLKSKTMSVVDALSKEKFATAEAQKALADYNAEKQRAIDNDSRAPQLILAAAQAKLKDALATKQQTAALIEKLLVDEGGARYLGGGALVGAALQAHDYLDKTKADIATFEQTVRGATIDLAKEAAKAAADPIEAIRQKFRLLSDTAIAAAAKNDRLAASLEKTLSGYARQEAAAVRAAQASQSAANRSSTEFGRSVTSSDAASIARASGFQVNSVDRTFASQKALYDRWVAAGRPSSNPVAKPGSSAHEFGNALDIQKTAGATVQRIKDAFAAEGVRLTKVFSEQGHWHVEWQRSAEDVRAVGDAHREATAAAHEMAKAEKDIFAWARKSADSVAAESGADAERRRFEEARRSFRTIMGDEDPFGDAVDAGAAALQARREQQARDRIEQQERLNEHLRLTADLASAAGDALGQAFGDAGGAIGNVLTVLGRYGAEQERINQSQLSDADKMRAKQALQMDSLLGLTDAAKRLFGEQTAGYRAIEAAEKALAVVRAVQTVRDVAAGAANMFASLGPFAFPAVGAMVAVMAGLGFSGGFSSGKAPQPANAGTGTVLGDSEAKSESIKRAIDQLRDVDTLMLSHSREMAASLRSIDAQIGGFAAQILKAGDIDASAGVQTGFKTSGYGNYLAAPFSLLSNIPIVGGVFGAVSSVLKSLFGTKTAITGTGLYGGAQSLGGILSGGFDAQNYTDIKKTKKFLGITTGTSYSTQYSGADPTLENQFTLILRSFNDAIAAAAGPLGESTEAIQQRLNGFVVNIGKIDLTGLTGEQITEKLTAIFGKAADEMAGAAFPGVAKYQKAGEGLFETAVRVSSTLETVGASLDLLAGGTRQLSMDAKLGIADQFDSLSALTSAADGYFKAYYTSVEQAAGQTARFATVFDSLGMAMPETLAGFRALVEAQDLTTAAGQSVYATLLQLAPAFADLQSSMAGAKSAADIASERQDLQRQLLELNGDTAAIRALDLAKLDVSNRALQQQVWAVQDAQKAADAADQLRQAWTSVGDTIETEIDRIRGLSGVSSEGGFAVLQGRFNAATAAARGGDQDAAKSLPGLSQALLTAAEAAATSRQELSRVQAMTASSLEATKAAIDAMTAAPTAAASTAALLAATSNTQAATTPAANDNADLRQAIEALREELAAMHSDNNAGHAATAGNTGRIARTMDNVTAESAGLAVSVAAAAA